MLISILSKILVVTSVIETRFSSLLELLLMTMNRIKTGNLTKLRSIFSGGNNDIVLSKNQMERNCDKQ